MTLSRSLLRGVRMAVKSTDFWGAWARGDDDVPGAVSIAGTRVNRETAQALAAVWACRNIIAGNIAALPHDVFVKRERARLPYRPKPQWVDTPNVEQTPMQALEQVLDSMLLDGTAYILTPRDERGRTLEYWPVHPDFVRPYRRDGRVLYDVHDPETGRISTLRGGQGGEMFHIPAYAAPGNLRGMPPLEVARTMLGSGLAAQEFAARFYGQGMNMAGVIEDAGEMTVEQARELKKDFARANAGLRNAHLPAVLSRGKWKPLGVTPEQAQFIETRKFTKQDIATFFLVPPYKIGIVEPGAVSYASVEQQAIDFLQTTLLPWIQRIEQAFTRYLLWDLPGVFLKINVDGLLRADFKSRQEGLAIQRQWGVINADEWRALEELQPVADGRGEAVIIPNNYMEAPRSGEPSPTGGTTDGA